MPVKIVWDDSQETVLRQIFTSSFDLSDWYEAVTQTCQMLNTVYHPVNVILDLSEFDQLPPDLINILNQSKSRYHTHQSAQITVVHPNCVKPMRTLLNNTDILTGSGVVASLDEAYHTFNRLQLLASVVAA